MMTSCGSTTTQNRRVTRVTHGPTGSHGPWEPHRSQVAQTDVFGLLFLKPQERFFTVTWKIRKKTNNGTFLCAWWWLSDYFPFRRKLWKSSLFVVSHINYCPCVDVVFKMIDSIIRQSKSRHRGWSFVKPLQSRHLRNHHFCTTTASTSTGELTFLVTVIFTTLKHLLQLKTLLTRANA